MRYLRYERQWVRLWVLGGRMARLSEAGERGTPAYRAVVEQYEATLAEIRRVQEGR